MMQPLVMRRLYSCSVALPAPAEEVSASGNSGTVIATFRRWHEVCLRLCEPTRAKEIMGKRFNLAGGTLMVAAMLVAATVSAEPLPRFEEDLAGMDGEALAELYKQPFVWHLAHGQYINEVCSHDLQFSPGEEQRPVHDAAETERIILEQVDDLRPIIPAIPPPWEWFTVVDAFGNTGLDLFLDAMGGFDSGFFSVPLLHLFDFRGSKLNGNELNYYFFGMAMTHQGFNWWQISAVECVTTQRAVGVPDTLPMQMPTVRAARWQPTRPCGSGVCPG